MDPLPLTINRALLWMVLAFGRLVEPRVHTIFEMLPYQSYAGLLKLTSMSFTADIWTSGQPHEHAESDSTVGLRGFCTEESLHAQECAGSHTAVAISNTPSAIRNN